jgi:hypothetical protein
MNRMSKYGVGFIVVASCALCVLPLRAEEEFLTGTPAIRYSLAKLNVLGSILMIGAHPDDENNAVLAYLSRGLKVRTGYLSCTACCERRNSWPRGATTAERSISRGPSISDSPRRWRKR